MKMKEFWRDVEKTIVRKAGTRKYYYRDLFAIKKIIRKHDGREDVLKRLSKKKQYKAYIRYLLSDIEELEETNEELRHYIDDLERELDDYRSGGEWLPEFE